MFRKKKKKDKSKNKNEKINIEENQEKINHGTLTINQFFLSVYNIVFIIHRKLGRGKISK
jgi:hypothetical protein